MPRPIQLAIQGGGAKITALVAALEAVQQLEHEGALQVTRIAGTSAGAIAGALYAARIRMSDVRAHLKGAARRIIAAYPRSQGKLNLLNKLRKAEPIWNIEPLRNELDALFQKAKVTTFSDIHALGITVSLVASDITNMKVHPYLDVEEPVVNALLGSAGIPFFFRGPSRRADDPPLLVDGGICENLPADLLADGDPSLGDVVGISFLRGKSRRNPVTFLQFGKALLDTAMENSMSRARRRLGANLYQIATEIDTFDFETSLTEGLGAPYDTIRADAYAWFKNFISKKSALPRPRKGFWDEESAYTMTNLCRVYDFQHAKKLFSVERSTTVIRAYSLRGEDDNRRPDEITRTYVFRPATEPIDCYKVWVSTHETGEFVESVPIVVDRAESSVESVLIPTRVDPSQPSAREFLLFFLPPLVPGDPREPYTLRLEDRSINSVGGLRTDARQDEMVVEFQRADRPVKEVELVVYIPAELGTLALTQAPGAAPGLRMTPEELGSKYPDLPGMVAYGWRGTDVPPRRNFGCKLALAGNGMP